MRKHSQHCHTYMLAVERGVVEGGRQGLEVGVVFVAVCGRDEIVVATIVVALPTVSYIDPVGGETQPAEPNVHW